MASANPNKKFAVIILGGSEPRPDIAKLLPADAVIVAADSGWGNARVLGLTPDVLIGDMDSILPADLAAARRSDATVIEFDADKDATDTELALTHAESIGCTDIVVVSGGGDRLDHVLGIIAALGRESLATCTVTAFIGSARFTVVRAGSPARIDAQVNSLLSIFAVGAQRQVFHCTALSGNSITPPCRHMNHAVSATRSRHRLLWLRSPTARSSLSNH